MLIVIPKSIQVIAISPWAGGDCRLLLSLFLSLVRGLLTLNNQTRYLDRCYEVSVYQPWNSEEFISDNRPQYFLRLQKFLNDWNVKQVTSSLYYPRSNGIVSFKKGGGGTKNFENFVMREGGGFSQKGGTNLLGHYEWSGQIG